VSKINAQNEHTLLNAQMKRVKGFKKAGVDPAFFYGKVQKPVSYMRVMYTACVSVSVN
jgi:hypothetical protein